MQMGEQIKAACTQKMPIVQGLYCIPIPAIHEPRQWRFLNGNKKGFPSGKQTIRRNVARDIGETARENSVDEPFHDCQRRHSPERIEQSQDIGNAKFVLRRRHIEVSRMIASNR